jgi:hypothetical protein
MDVDDVEIRRQRRRDKKNGIEMLNWDIVLLNVEFELELEWARILGLLLYILVLIVFTVWRGNSL